MVYIADFVFNMFKFTLYFIFVFFYSETGFVNIENKTSVVEVNDGSKDSCLHFEVDAFPTSVTYVWSKDDKLLDSTTMNDVDSPSFVINGSTLCIKHVDVRYEGNYTLVASNQYETDSGTTQLLVLGKICLQF